MIERTVYAALKGHEREVLYGLLCGEIEMYQKPPKACQGESLWKVDIRVTEVRTAPDLREYDSSERGMVVAR